MSNRQYPRTMPADWCLTQNRPHVLKAGSNKCDGCDHVFVRDEPLCVVETQVGWFRGDDEVEYFCESCAKVRGIETPRERRVRFATAEIAALYKNIAKPDGDTPGRRKRLRELELLCRETAEPKS